MRRSLAPLIAVSLAAGACADPGAPAPPPRLDSASVTANANMTIAAVVRVFGRADSIAIRYRAPSQSSDSTTPAFPFTGDSARLPLLGLLPQTSYSLRVVLWRSGDTLSGAPLSFATGALPADLPSYTAGGSNPLPGFVVFAAGKYGLAIDNTGRVVWYHLIEPNGPGLNFMAEPNGHYVARPAVSTITGNSRWIEFDVNGDTVRTFTCGNGLLARFHDLILESDGGYWIMCDETRTMDLTAFGGIATAQVTGSVVQHVAATGSVLFQWSPFDHFAIDDADPGVLTGAAVNWTHGNSLALDTDGHLLVAFRSLSEITKINSQTGAVMWRMGGRRNQFTFLGAPNPGFNRQHNVRVVGPRRIILLDNSGATESRFEQYRVDPETTSATLEQSYGSTPAVQTLIGGSVQVAGPNRFLVSFGTQGRVEEFDAAGTMLWRINGNPGYVFRAQRIHSLYAPGVGSER